jgi:hypothetical protein
LFDKKQLNRLMQMLTVMEYNDSNGNWYEVHLIILPLLTSQQVYVGAYKKNLKKAAKPEKAFKSSPKVFLSYAREDIKSAQHLFNDLRNAGVEVWFDQVSLLPGHKWKVAIQQAIEKNRFFIALLSTKSVNKMGYVQKELKEALDILDQYPESSIFLIPVRLDACNTSYERLRDLQWVDMFPDWNNGLARILKSLKSQQ